MKPLWKSKTVRANVLTFAIALFPHLETYSRNGRLTGVDITAIVGTFLLTCVAIEGRHDSTEIVYTPRGWPGRNPEDARQIEENRRM